MPRWWSTQGFKACSRLRPLGTSQLSPGQANFTAPNHKSWSDFWNCYNLIMLVTEALHTQQKNYSKWRNLLPFKCFPKDNNLKQSSLFFTNHIIQQLQFTSANSDEQFPIQIRTGLATCGVCSSYRVSKTRPFYNCSSWRLLLLIMHSDAQPFLLKGRQKLYWSFFIDYRRSPQMAKGRAYTYKYAENGQRGTQQKYFSLN